MKDDKYLPDNINDSVIDDADLRQCEWCDYVIHKDEIPTANDPTCSDGTIQYCPECDEGEPFKIYIAKK